VIGSGKNLMMNMPGVKVRSLNALETLQPGLVSSFTLQKLELISPGASS
jgi:hypothetical protein